MHKMRGFWVKVSKHTSSSKGKKLRLKCSRVKNSQCCPGLIEYVGICLEFNDVFEVITLLKNVLQH